MNLSERAMLVSLSISQWNARRSDKRVNQEVAERHQTTEKAGNYSKSLLPNAPASFKAISEAAQKAYDTHTRETLPWSNDGQRILLASNFTHYASEMRRLREDFEDAVAAFIPDYPSAVQQARVDLNGLFNALDYPSDLSAKFSLTTQVLPMPAAQDFRVALDAVSTAAVKADIEAQVRTSVEAAASDAWNRLRDVLVKMSVRLNTPIGEKESVYRDSLFSNVEDVLEVLPRLNILGDPCLDAAVETVRQQVLTPFSPQQCRVDPGARTEAAKKVDSILASMAGGF